MTPKQEAALRLAREALKLNCSSQTESPATKAITAIDEALDEQSAPPPPPPPPECQTEAEKTAFAFGWWKALEQKRKVDSALDRMAENARELGLDYEPIVEQVEDSVGMGHGAWDMVEPKKLAKAFHEALAEQPAQQQELVANREDLIRMAREAGMPPVEITSDKPVLYPVPDAIQRFAALVAAAEREAFPNLTAVINWLENGCDPKEAAKELRLYAAAISARRKA